MVDPLHFPFNGAWKKKFFEGKRLNRSTLLSAGTRTDMLLDSSVYSVPNSPSKGGKPLPAKMIKYNFTLINSKKYMAHYLHPSENYEASIWLYEGL